MNGAVSCHVGRSFQAPDGSFDLQYSHGDSTNPCSPLSLTRFAIFITGFAAVPGASLVILRLLGLPHAGSPTSALPAMTPPALS